MKNFLFSAFLGLAALALVNFTAPYTTASIPLTPLSLAVSSVLGVPGVTLLVLLDTIILL